VSGVGDYTEELVSHMSTVEPTVVPLPEGDDPVAYLRRVLRIRTVEPDLVHVQHEYGMFGPFTLMTWLVFPAVYLQCRLLGIPVVVTVHEGLNGDLVSEPLVRVKRVYVRLVNLCIAWTVDHVVFLSSNTKREFLRSVDVRSHTVLPHGANTTRRIDCSRAEAKRRLGYEPDDLVVSEPGYVEPRKGTAILNQLAARMPEYEFLVAGGPASDAYREYFEEIRRNAPDNLRVTGRLPEDEFHTTFVASDLVVLPYRETEQRGVVNTLNQSGILNRCTTYGNVLVTSDLEYFGTMNEEWGCLHLVDFEDVETAVDEIEALLADGAERDRLVEAARAYAEANSFDSVARRHGEIYRRLVESRSSPT
jgi:glycosyltransferase involved in cell wall biosynthesis